MVMASAVFIIPLITVVSSRIDDLSCDSLVALLS